MPLAAMKMEVPRLEKLAREIRARIIENSHRTSTPHLGSCLSCVDILVAAYFHVLRIDPADPRTYYLAAVGGVRRTTDGGATWSVEYDLLYKRKK